MKKTIILKSKIMEKWWKQKPTPNGNKISMKELQKLYKKYVK